MIQVLAKPKQNTIDGVGKELNHFRIIIAIKLVYCPLNQHANIRSQKESFSTIKRKKIKLSFPWRCDDTT